jgi:TonB family protein
MARARSRGRWAGLVFLTLLSAVAGISADTDEPVVELGPGVTPPRVTHQVTPNSDSGAGGFRVSGTVLIGLVVSSQGLPRDVHVVRSLDKDLDRNAVEAVQQWRFEPARKGGQPVAVRVTVEIRFQDL